MVENYQGATVIEQRETNSEVGKGYYVYAEFESPLMGFVDDVEFFFQPDGKSVEYRSASRLGKDDLKANRKRIKTIRVALQEKVRRTLRRHLRFIVMHAKRRLTLFFGDFSCRTPIGRRKAFDPCHPADWG